MIGAALGAHVVAIDIDEQKLELARTLGAVAVVNARKENPWRAIQDLTQGGAHVSIDALGSQTTCRNSVKSLRKRGRHVQIGLLLAEEANPKLPMIEVIGKELELLGSHGMPAHRYGAMLGMIAAGKLEPARLIGKTVSLDEAGAELEAMGAFAQQGVTGD